MRNYNEKTVCEIVRQMEEEDRLGNTKISKYVTYSQRQNINQIDAYINSKHISGSTDSLGREKPFFNIVTSARNIWFRATDIDRKDIRFNASKRSDMILAMMASILLIKWMRKARFGKYLNNWGRTLATYGSAVSQFTKKGGEMVCEVVPWNKFICDPIDFDNNPKIKILWLTPSQLKANKNYDQDVVDDLIQASSSRETAEGEQVDNKDNYIQLYEVYGNFPLSYLDEEDEETYVDQIHVLSYLVNEDGKYDDYTLYKGRKKNNLRIDHLIEEDGRTMAIGAVENLFEAQWMMNHTQKMIKDHLDIASKWITQTSDKNFLGQNVINAIENGDILIHKEGMPLTRVNNSADISAQQAFASQWRQAAYEIVNISESMQGQVKSGTAWRQTEALLQESHSLFELMIENKAISLEEILQEWIIPHLKTKMDTSEEIGVIMDEYNIQQIDAMYIPNKATKMTNRALTDKVLNGEMIMEGEQEMLMQENTRKIQEGLDRMGSQRFINPSDIKTKTWKELFKDFEWDVEINISGESEDTNSVFASLTTILQTIAGSINPQTGESTLLENPKTRLIIDKILEKTHAISPVELNSVGSKPGTNPTDIAEQNYGGEKPARAIQQS